MATAAPSPSALAVAIRRAQHQRWDDPKVFEDPLAVAILGPSAERELVRRTGGGNPISVGLRAWLVARHRFAEDEFARARARGVRQYVLLGAGLDTFGYRQPAEPAPVAVFEVDRPATQAWKRARLADAGIVAPPSVRFVGVDFEEQSWATELASAGFDRSRPAWFSWLGVTMFLSPGSIDQALAYIGGLPAGSGVVFDYSVPPGTLSPVERLVARLIARHLSRRGELFRTHLAPDEVRRLLARHGFGSVTDLGRAELNASYFAHRSDALRVRGSLVRLVSATVGGGSGAAPG